MPFCIAVALHNEMILKHKEIVRFGFNKTVEECFNFQSGKIMLAYTSFETLDVYEMYVVFKLIARRCFQR